MALFGNRSYQTNPPQYFNKDAERQERLERYRKTWEAYLAELDDPIVKDSYANDNVKVNPARAIVNTGVYFLFGSELLFQESPNEKAKFGKGGAVEGDVTPTKSDPEYLTELNRAWKANRKASFLFNMGLSGAIHGHVFVKIIPNAAGTKNQYPRFVLLDPANVDVDWDPNDCTRPLKFTIEYVTEDEESGKPVLYTQVTEAVRDAFGTILKWTIQDYKHDMQYDNQLGWFPGMGEGQPIGDPVDWNYTWPPIEQCQNIEIPHMFWGMPDLDESSVEVIESLQRAMSSLNKIIRVHASPRMFAQNVMPDQVDEIDISADNIIALPNSDSDLKVLEVLSNLDPSIKFTDKLREDLLEMVQTPAIALGKFETASTSISGVTLAILYAPLLQKTELKRISYGDMIERLNEKALILMGYTDETVYENLMLVWPEAMPGSAYLERQTLTQDAALGVSKRTLTSRLGYDPMEEEQNRIEEQLTEMEAKAKMQEKYAPKPAPSAPGAAAPKDPHQKGPGNPTKASRNPNGSMGGTNSAGKPKTQQDVKK